MHKMICLMQLVLFVDDHLRFILYSKDAGPWGLKLPRFLLILVLY